MDAAWLTQLAATGAAALVGAAATDAWQQARSGFARLLARRPGSEEAIVLHRLDALSAEIEQAPPVDRDEIRRRQQPLWQARLEDLIEKDDAAAQDLAGLTDRLRAQLPAHSEHWVQHITAHPGGTAYGAQGPGSSVIIHQHGEELPRPGGTP
jgi:hypothetical protein